MKKLIALLSIISVTLYGKCQDNDPVIMTIDGENVYQSEFKYIYTKNDTNPSYKKKKLDEYMELFINYKLKVREAERLQYDTIPTLIKELAQYRRQLSLPYMIDKSKNEALVKEAYDRTINEVRASHILIRTSGGDPKDTLRAYNKAMDLREKIRGGEDFAEMARQHSEDPSAKSNSGDLGYFTALQMVYPFEQAAFKTKKGDVSMPVKTQFGYHLIKVLDKRKSGGKMNAAHIMILSNEEMSDEERKQAKEKIDEIHGMLQNGENFEDLAKKFSEDKSSGGKGGVLPTFGAGTRQRMVPSFEEAAFSLQNDGDYSAPVLSPYGWHIIKRISVEPMPTFDKMKRELKLKVERDERAEQSKLSFIDGLKKEYGYGSNYGMHKAYLEGAIDGEVFHGHWKGFEDKGVNHKVLFSLQDTGYTLRDFEEYILKNQKRSPEIPIHQYVNEQYDQFVIDKITEFEDSRLEAKHPEFKALMREYHDGILVFEIMQNEIWEKAAKDSLGVKNYYDQHQGDFTYPVRYKGDLYKCKDKETALKVYDMVKNDTLDPMEIRKDINKDSQLNLNIKSHTFNSQTTDAFRKGKNKELKPGKKHKVRKFKPGVNKIFKRNDDYYVFEVEEVFPPRPRKFEEAKGLVTAAYQNQLEKEWLESLRSKYDVQVNREVLYSVGDE